MSTQATVLGPTPLKRDSSAFIASSPSGLPWQPGSLSGFTYGV